MAIEFQCPECAKRFQVADHFAGKRARCKCGAIVDVPAVAAPDLDQEVDDLLPEELQRPAAAAPTEKPVVARAATRMDVLDPGAVLEAIQQVVLEHVNKAADVFQQVAITIDVTRCEIGAATKVEFEVAGTVNWQRLDRRIRSSRKRGVTAHGGGVVGGLVSATLSAALSHAAGLHSGDDLLDQCLRECIADVCIAIDELAGRQQSRSAKLWRGVLLGRWIAAVATLVAMSLVLVSISHGRLPLRLALIHVLVPSAIMFWLVHVVGLAVMPKEFFVSDPRGRKALARSGVKSVVGLRLLVAVLVVILIGLLICSGMLGIMGAYQEGQKKAGPHDAQKPIAFVDLRAAT